MPYPLTHLTVARRFLEPLSIGNAAAFFLGSVAPDAYHWMKQEKNLAERKRAHLTDEGNPFERIRNRFRGAASDFEIGYALPCL